MINGLSFSVNWMKLLRNKRRDVYAQGVYLRDSARANIMRTSAAKIQFAVTFATKCNGKYNVGSRRQASAPNALCARLIGDWPKCYKLTAIASREVTAPSIARLSRFVPSAWTSARVSASSARSKNPAI